MKLSREVRSAARSRCGEELQIRPGRHPGGFVSDGRHLEHRLCGSVDRAVCGHQDAQRFLRSPDRQPRNLQSRFIGGDFLRRPQLIETRPGAARQPFLRVLQMCLRGLARQ